MKFLITGAYGFVGTNLCKYLVERGHECIALDIPAAKREGVPYSQFFSWEELEKSLEEKSLVDSRQSLEGKSLVVSGQSLVDSRQSLEGKSLVVSRQSLLGGVDCVVHLAGKAHDLKKVASEQSYFDINVGLTKRIYEEFRKEVEKVGGQRTFIYFSSSKARAEGNAYGRSKLAAEQYLLSTSTSNLNLCILRPAMIHGPGNKGNLNLLWGIAKRGLPWPLAAFENKRSFTSIGNICAAVEALAKGDKFHSPPQPSTSTFFIADDEMISTNRLIELIAEACGRKAKLWRIPQGLMRFAARIGDILHLPLNTERIEKLTEDSFVDNTALKAALGWSKMPIAAEDGMRETLASFRK